MPRNHKKSSTNGHANGTTKKTKDKPTYKIIVLGSGGVGKVRVNVHLYDILFCAYCVYLYDNRFD